MYLYEISLIDMSDALWDFVLSVQVLMCTIFIPVCLLFRIPFATYRINIKGKTKIPILGIILIVIYLIWLSIWSSEIKSKKLIDGQGDMFTPGRINILVEILVNYGVYLMAFMSAYGAVWCPYFYFNHIDTSRDDLKHAKKKTKN